MLRSMYSGISGMKVNQTKLDVIGNNIANVSTTGYKASSARFTDMLYQNSSEATAPTTTKGGTNATQVGLGAKLASINKVMGQGNALSTGRSLDVCVDGEGYIIVGSGDTSFAQENTIDAGGVIVGGENSICYTRDGNFTLDKDGNLLTSTGYRVMGYFYEDTNKQGVSSIGVDGVANYVNPDANDGGNPPVSTLQAVGQGAQLNTLRIPNTVKYTDANGITTEQPVASFSIGSDGLIIAVLGNGSQSVLGQIATAKFSNPEGLKDLGGGLSTVSANSGVAVARSPRGALAAGFENNSGAYGDLVQGCLEASNVDLTEQFTDMITAARAFQASSKMISTGDEILQTITGLMR
ncbi:flagellar hook-basal body complex protein [uncultured Clostridium sp.]|uniref:flagellar hook-basal body complex protein n=1 Tax=uncultured Clostridium sp. TaxID=59620 RepID=UPI0025F05EF3|nr:flagellar hook-basal body complex protein [uncultured Clostridium sp.]